MLNSSDVWQNLINPNVNIDKNDGDHQKQILISDIDSPSIVFVCVYAIKDNAI